MKLLTLNQIHDIIIDNSSVFIPGCSAQPTALLDSWPGSKNTHFISNFVSGINDFNLLPFEGNTGSHTLFFMPPPHRVERIATRLHYLPLTYYGIDHYLRHHRSLDFAFVHTSLPDSDGKCSLGPSAEFASATLNSARFSVALLNPNYPTRIRGTTLFLRDFDFAVELESPMLDIPQQPADPIADAIAHNVSTLIDDGDCLQIGIGKLADTIQRALKNKRDLRMHSGILSSSIRNLVEAGVIADEHNALRCATLVGDAAFYSWCEDRPQLRVSGVDYTHAPAVLAKIERFVAINSAIEVDLRGQANAENRGGHPISGPGGLPDFAHAAHRSPGGRSIIALPSRAGAHSRIVGTLPATSPVTVARHDVDFVVTELGIADLRNRLPYQRAEALIGIAHPDHQPELWRYITSPR